MNDLSSRTSRIMLSRRPIKLFHALPWIIAVVFYFTAGGYLSLGTTVLISILLVISLDLALGFSGIITLGQAAFYGFGAYTAALFAVHVTADPILGLVVATLLAAIVGLITGALILHTHGQTFLMLTLAISSLMAEFANRATDLTGGDDGMAVPTGALLGHFKFDIWGQTAYIYALVVLFIWFLIAWRIVGSPFGRSLDGIRQSPARMRAIGTPVWWRLLAVYTLSAAMAGSAGALEAQTTRFVGLNTLGVFVAAMAVVMLVLGGTRRIYGAFIGAAVYVVVQDLAAKINPYYWMFIIGAMLMATVLFLEGGLMSLIDRCRDIVVRRFSREDSR
jgi:branched-chain amino acid transport system permease protein